MKRIAIIILTLVIAVLGGVFTIWSVYSLAPSVEAFSFSDIFKKTQDDVLYSAYKAYMLWVDKGVKGGDHKLSKSLQKILDPYYKNNLNKISYSYTTRLDNLGMTDCYHIYFGDENIVDKLKTQEKLSERQFRWLAHELTHSEQCYRVGGRKKYAVRWFSEVKGVIVDAVRSGDFKDIIKDIFNAQKLAKYDNNMPMEEEATKRSDEVLKKAYSKQ